MQPGGGYLIICDSDDWVEFDAYEKALKKAKGEDADILLFGYYANYADGTQREWIRTYSDLNDIEKVRAEIMRTSAYTSWNKLVRRSLITDNGITYEPGINMGEDVLILHKLLNIKFLKLSLLPEALYHYRQREGGYTHAMKPESVLQLCRIHEWTKKNLDANLHATALKGNASGIVFESLRCRKFPKDVFRSTVNELDCKYLIASPRSPQKLVVLIAKLFGWKIGKMAHSHIYLPLFS